MDKEKDFCHGQNCIFPTAQIHLPMMPHWCGHQLTTSRNYRWDGMRRGPRPLVLWQYTIAGCGMVEYQNRQIPVRPGEAFLLQLPEKHLYYLPDKPGYWEFLFLAIEGDEAIRLTSALRDISGSVSTAYASDETVQKAWKIIRCSMEKNSASAEKISSLVYSFMMSLFENGSSLPQKDNDLIRKIHLYLLANLTGKISVEEVAAFAGFSRSHFCRIFRKLCGKGIHEYLLELRLETAIRKLRNENLSVKETAAECGFDDSGYFCKVFRKFSGMTPAHFRKERHPSGDHREKML